MDILKILLGAFLALGGAWVQHRFQKGEKDLDRLRERNKLLREKAEIIFQDMDTISRYSMVAAIQAGLQAEVPAMEIDGGTLSRMKALLAIYFPESREIVERHEQNVSKNVEPHVGTMMGAANDKDLAAAKAKIFALASIEVTSFIKELRVFMTKEVEKLL